ncbi:hypothetical protein GGR50DRAFT_264367 [Xylaria sp. CBS 124048]|nr:hypothetical protein GGR50DRAFT_264367 [Xylaria sp. CBS 124048]
MHKANNSSKTYNSQPNGKWSAWKWSSRYGKWYSERYNDHGHLEYTWADGPALSGNEHAYDTPRFETPIEQVTTNFENLNVTPATYSQYQGAQNPNQGGYQVDDQYLRDSSGYTINGRSGDNHDDQLAYSQAGKGKGIASADVYNTQGQGHVITTPASSHTLVQYGCSKYPPDIPEAESESRNYATPVLNGSTIYTHSNDEHEVERALGDDRSTVRGKLSHDRSSRSATKYGAASMYSHKHRESSHQSSQMVSRAPTIQTQRGYVNTTPGGVGGLPEDPLRPSREFQPGEVLKIFWSEPLGQSCSSNWPPISDRKIKHGRAGQFYEGYRRFIIVSTDKAHHSSCVAPERRTCSWLCAGAN